MPLTDDLAVYWRLDEASGNRSAAFGGVTLTDTNTVTSGTGKVSALAADFESANAGGEALASTDNATLSLGADTPFTWVFWYNAESLTGLTHRPLVIKATSGDATTAYQLYWVTASERWEFMVGNGSTFTFVSLPFAASGGTASWHLIIAWHDPVADKLFLQLDNGTPAEVAWSGGTQDEAGAFNIGRFGFSTGLRWDGLIGPAGFWKRALTTAERTRLWNNGLGLDYPFPEAALTVAAASSVTVNAIVAVAGAVTVAAASSVTVNATVLLPAALVVAGLSSVSVAANQLHAAALVVAASSSVEIAPATLLPVACAIGAVSELTISADIIAGEGATTINARLLVEIVSSVSIRARRRMPLPPPMGLTAVEMLRAAVADLDRHFAEVFTVEGFTGELRGRLVRAAEGVDIFGEGAWPSADATLYVATDVAWTPTQGKKLTVGGSLWLTGAPILGRASWEIPLASPHR